MPRPKVLEDQKPEEYSQEDLYNKRKGKYTISDLKNDDPHWLDKAIAKVHPARGNDYCLLDEGILTVNQINSLLKSLPVELSFVDENNQLVYFNHNLPPEKMLSARKREYLGYSLGDVHHRSARAHRNVESIINALRKNKTKVVKGAIPWNTRKNFVTAFWTRMEDDDKNYAGVNEMLMNIWPIVEYYLKTTGQKLVDDPDATSGATFKGGQEAVDARTAASKKDNADANKQAEELGIADQFVDDTTGASKKESTDASTGASSKEKTDTTTGASKH